MVAAGYGDVPVVTISTKLKTLNPQPGFRVNLAKYLYKALLGMLYTDALSSLYHATAVRERRPGDARALTDRLLAPFSSGAMPISRPSILAGLKQAVAEFNAIETDNLDRPRVGLVGEIYVKYNRFINHDLVHWLMGQGFEVVLPPLLSFFLGSYVGYAAGIEARVRAPDWLSLLLKVTRGPVFSMVDQAEAILKSARHYHPRSTIPAAASSARRVLNLTHQYGEGWLLAGEVGQYVAEGINHVICLQPFGCIANHVIAKGVSRRMQALHPDLNLLFLDLDPGLSEVNYLNRLHFFTDQARTSAAPPQETMVPLAV